MEYEIQEINIDLITELKAQGRHWDANNLLQAFQEDVKKNKHQLSVELLRQDKNIKHCFGVCKASGCNKKRLKGKTLCTYHLQLHNRRNKEGEPKYIVNKTLQKNKCVLSNGPYPGHRLNYYISVSPDGEIHESVGGM